MFTFLLTHASKQVNFTIPEEQIAQYKKSILEQNPNISQQELNVLINQYIRNATATKSEGMDFSSAFKTALIWSFVIFIILFLVILLKGLHNKELFGNPSGIIHTSLIDVILGFFDKKN